MHRHCQATLHRHCRRLLFPLLPLLVITVTNAAAQITPSDNFFFGLPNTPGASPHSAMLGSAPSPTPADLCVYGSGAEHCYTDATKTKRKIFVPDLSAPNPGHYREYRPGDEKLIEDFIKSRKQVAREHFRLGGNSASVSPVDH